MSKNDLYFVTHKDSRPKGSRKHFDFLAVTQDKEEAKRLSEEMPEATGYISGEELGGPK
jgi:hypothetical protein